MLKALSKELLNSGLLERTDAVVVGVSGGPDSMALLNLLLELNERHDWELKISVAHLNHALRGKDANEDAAFVRAVADGLSVPCVVETRDIGSLAEDDAAGIEELGRRERYAFFERVCISVGAKVVAVGHHADDNAETILHRVLRGTGLRGLAGIPRDRTISPHSDVRLIRPLLNLTRANLLKYLKNSGIAYREDRTNISNDPMRNRIRNLILPKVEAEVNPQVREALTRLGEQARWLEEYLGETIQRTFETLVISRTDQALALNVDTLARKSRIVQTEITRLAYRSFGLGEQDLAFTHLVSVLELISDPASGKQVDLPQGMTVEKLYHQLIFSLPSDEPREMIALEIAVHLPGVTLLPVRRLKIDCEISEANPEQIAGLRRASHGFEEYLDLESVHPPLVVRTKRPGDRFLPLGAPGSKKISEFLIDSKVDPSKRERVAVLCDRLGPVWIIGHRIDDRVKLTALTRRVLHLRARTLKP